jgi:hypothetical protein
MECADLSALWPKRFQGTALQGAVHFRMLSYTSGTPSAGAHSECRMLNNERTSYVKTNW